MTVRARSFARTRPYAATATIRRGAGPPDRAVAPVFKRALHNRVLLLPRGPSAVERDFGSSPGPRKRILSIFFYRAGWAVARHRTRRGRPASRDRSELPDCRLASHRGARCAIRPWREFLDWRSRSHRRRLAPSRAISPRSSAAIRDHRGRPPFIAGDIPFAIGRALARPLFHRVISLPEVEELTELGGIPEIPRNRYGVWGLMHGHQKSSERHGSCRHAQHVAPCLFSEDRAMPPFQGRAARGPASGRVRISPGNNAHGSAVMRDAARQNGVPGRGPWRRPGRGAAAIAADRSFLALARKNVPPRFGACRAEPISSAGTIARHPFRRNQK